MPKNHQIKNKTPKAGDAISANDLGVLIRLARQHQGLTGSTTVGGMLLTRKLPGGGGSDTVIVEAFQEIPAGTMDASGVIIPGVIEVWLTQKVPEDAIPEGEEAPLWRPNEEDPGEENPINKEEKLYNLSLKSIATGAGTGFGGNPNPIALVVSRKDGILVTGEIGGGAKLITGRVKGFWGGSVGKLKFQEPVPGDPVSNQPDTGPNDDNNWSKMLAPGYEQKRIEVYKMIPFAFPPPEEGADPNPDLTPEQELTLTEHVWTTADYDAWEAIDPTDPGRPEIEPIVGQHEYEFWTYGLPSKLVRNAMVKGIKNQKDEIETITISPDTIRMEPDPAFNPPLP